MTQIRPGRRPRRRRRPRKPKKHRKPHNTRPPWIKDDPPPRRRLPRVPAIFHTLTTACRAWPQHHVGYKTPFGTLLWCQAIDSEGRICEKRETKNGRIVRIILSMPRDHEWRVVLGTGELKLKERRRTDHAIRAWFDYRGYRKKHLRMRWLDAGLFVKWASQNQHQQNQHVATDQQQ